MPYPPYQVAITGTNGKTSIAHMVQSLWMALGVRGASIGTLGVRCSDLAVQENCMRMEWMKGPSLTTYEPERFQKILHFLHSNGVDYVVFEASSHGLHQDRCQAATLSAAGFSNFSQDHLDYHITESAYFEAKTRLFTHYLPPFGTMVLNQDDGRFNELLEIALKRNHTLITVSTQVDSIYASSPTLFTTDHHLGQLGSSFTCWYNQKPYPMFLPLIGEFQINNLLIALGLIMGNGFEFTKIIEGISTIPPLKGRMEWAGTSPSGGRIIVDFAHTPSALKHAILSVKSHTRGRIILVFGCGGNRDHTKRPLMGAVANDHADLIIVTNDNPRFENATDIRHAIMVGCPSAISIDNRREAILYGISLLKKEDCLLICGKGHEEGQIIQGHTYPFKDQDVVKEVSVGEY